jgi:tRNA nucleotidyltransferase/poly(A) polymerase
MEIYLIHLMEKRFRKWFINFIGDADKRIKEDYLRILRYLRFFLNYSNNHIIQKY